MTQLGEAQRVVRRERRRTLRGLIDPNPGFARLLLPIGVMSSPPTVTPGAGASGAAGGPSAITNGVDIDDTSDVFQYWGAQAGQGTVSPDTASTSPRNVSNNSPSNGPADRLYVAGTFGVVFATDAPKIELRTKGLGSGALYRLEVVGEGYDALAPRMDTANDGLTYRILYDFGSRRTRILRFEFSGSLRFYGVAIGPNDSIWNPHLPLGPKVVILGDSYTEGTGSDYGQLGCFGFALARHFGWRNLVCSGSGSTGYVADAGGTRTTFLTRVQKDVINEVADIVINCGGINDSNAGQAAVHAGAAATFAAERAGLPKAILIATGPWRADGSPSALAVQCRDAIKQAAADEGVHLFIDNFGGPYPYGGSTIPYVNKGWITGLGKVGSTTGSGNADLFTATDGSHPSTAGHDYLGARIAAAIAAALPL